MRRQMLLTVALTLSATGTASADMGPPPGFSRVPRDLVLEVESEFPGYRFWLVLHSRVEPLDLAPDRSFRVGGEGRGGSHRLAHIVAAPVGMVEGMGEGKFHEAFLAGKLPPGVFRSDEIIDFSARVPFYDSRERVIDRYGVEFEPGQPVRLWGRTRATRG